MKLTIALLFHHLFIQSLSPSLGFGHTCDSNSTAGRIILGREPFCSIPNQSCEQYGFINVGEEKASCFSGEQKLCKLKTVQIGSYNETVFNFYTWNLKNLPWSIWRDGQRERTCRVPKAIADEFKSIDAVIFQEVYTDGCICGMTLKTIMNQYGFEYFTPILGKEGFGGDLRSLLPGGVVIYSRWAIKKMAGLIFRANPFVSRLSARGAVYTQIQRLGKTWNLFGVHLQPNRQDHMVRVKQVVELNDFIDKQVGLKLRDLAPIILGGDFNEDLNVGEEKVTTLSNILNMEILNNRGYKFTFDSKENNMADENERSFLDYVMIRRSSIPLIASGYMEVTKFQQMEPIEFCKISLSPHYIQSTSWFCIQKKTTQFLSDHYAVRGNIVLVQK